jgi:cell division protein FtsZ
MDCERGIALVGCGGAGVNFVARSGSKCEDWAKVYAVEAEAKHLIMVKVKNSLLMGPKTLRGFGARGDPKLAERGAMESRPDFLKMVQGFKTVFVVVGLAGNTGTAAAVLISKLAKEAGARVVALGILPFVEEGPVVNRNAQKGLTHLQNACDMVVVAKNDQLLSLHPKLDLGKALQLMDAALLGEVERITAIGVPTGSSGDNMVFLDLGVSSARGS